MITLDTNVLVHAHRADSSWHAPAKRCVKELAEGRRSWAIPWPCLHEFLAIATHPRIWLPPTPLPLAIEQVEAWMESPSLVLIGEGPGYWDRFKEAVANGRVAGPMVHDARVAAVALLHEVDELWTADRDFGRFPGLKVRNPLVS